MTEFRRYGRLSDHLYKFIAALASREKPDWGEREDIEMTLRFIRRLEVLHRVEESKERWEQHQRRQARLEKKKADVVKLVADDNERKRTDDE